MEKLNKSITIIAETLVSHMDKYVHCLLSNFNCIINCHPSIPTPSIHSRNLKTRAHKAPTSQKSGDITKKMWAHKL